MIIEGEYSRPRKDWYTLDEIVELCSFSRRTANTKCSRIPSDLIRIRRNGVGRPRKLYHFSALPELEAAHNQNCEGGVSCSPIKSGSAHPGTHHDLALASLRRRAIAEYDVRRCCMTEAEAAAATVAAWARSPQTETYEKRERIGRKTVTKTHEVTLGGFNESSLRRWASIYRNSKRQLKSLAFSDVHNRGRRRKEIPENLLDLIHGKAVSTARSEIKAAIRYAREYWPGEWPDVSNSTIIRRIRERDPHRKMDSLGRGGHSRLMQEQVPDIERDRSKMRWNEEWQLDDFSEDWYALSSEGDKAIRPYSYGIFRVATRQWIYGIASEVPITQDQVRTMVGSALADPRCGIPDHITFERGTIACDDYLEDQLNALGIKVHRTSMDGGSVHPDAVTDRAKGHFQGKAPIERAIREHHRLGQFFEGQVGTDERHTAPQRTETLKAMAIRAAREGKPLLLPKWNQAQARVFAMMEKQNNTPCGGLPDTIDTETGNIRSMTPNEYAMVMRDEAVRVMDDAYLPLFYRKAVEVPVTKNGCKINGRWYGRWDEDLHDLKTATVFAEKLCPDICYVEELGRCVERYEPSHYGETDDQQHRKNHVRKSIKSQYVQLVDRYRQSEQIILDAAKSMPDPVTDRTRKIVTNDALAQRARDLTAGVNQRRDRMAAKDRRFNLSDPSDTSNRASTPRRGLLSRAGEMEKQLAVLGAEQSTEDDIFDDFGEA